METNLISQKMFKYIICLYLFISSLNFYAQNVQRPFIWVNQNDKAQILHKIETQDWAKETYDAFIKALDEDVNLHLADKDKFLRGLPFDWDNAKSNEIPPFHLTYHIEDGVQKNLDNITDKEFKHGREIIRYLEIGVNSGMAYFITRDEKYAQCATDILNAFVNSVLQSKVFDWRGRGGWLFPYDGFREVRTVGDKVPLIYDFIATFIKNGGQPYDIIKKEKINFPLEKTQEVFRTYADITINYGHPGSNHSVLEAPSLVYNALALEDEKEREKLLSYFLTESTENQDALNVMVRKFKEKGDVWPETSNYLTAVSSILTRLMLVVNRYNPDLKLGDKYPNVLFSLPKLEYLVYPNNEIIRWGDGKRYGTPNYSNFEDAYLLGLMDNNEEVINEFGPLLRRAIKEGKYKRNSMYSVLNHGVEIPSNMAEFELPRTDKVRHAGIFLQRNLSSTNQPEDGLMCFVGGAHMVHGHAEGMNIELYGLGEVLGVDNGNGRYQQDIHENYSRIFAAHNTVIVNGSSQGEGGWVNLGINTVQLNSMEPMPLEKALSPNHSFSRTSFLDDKGDKAEATQERTLALIRTSPTTGYYMDVFRSKSKLPNEFHDYLYHNIGDELKFINQDLPLAPDKNRFMANANREWKQNGQYRNPGWHFFNDVQSSKEYHSDVRARFAINKLKDNKKRYMNLYIAGNKNREYSKVMAPKTFQAPEPYDKQPTPTLVIRQNGEAWTNPFAVIYEPTFDGKSKSGIQSVTTLVSNGLFNGFKVISKINNKLMIQYIINQAQSATYENKELEFNFAGTFAVITFDENKEIQSMYIGEGSSFKHKTMVVQSKDNLPIAAYIDFSGEEYKLNTTENTELIFSKN